MSSRRAARGVMMLLTMAWTLGALAVTGYAVLDVVHVAARNAGRSEDEIRSRRYGDRWPLYQALAALPADAIIVIPGGGDEVLHYARYYAYPRPVLRAPLVEPGLPAAPGAREREYTVELTGAGAAPWTILPPRATP